MVLPRISCLHFVIVSGVSGVGIVTFKGKVRHGVSGNVMCFYGCLFSCGGGGKRASLKLRDGRDRAKPIRMLKASRHEFSLHRCLALTCFCGGMNRSVDSQTMLPNAHHKVTFAEVERSQSHSLATPQAHTHAIDQSIAFAQNTTLQQDRTPNSTKTRLASLAARRRPSAITSPPSAHWPNRVPFPRASPEEVASDKEFIKRGPFDSSAPVSFLQARTKTS